MTPYDELADALYAVPPSQFVAARDAAAAEARADGDRELATRLRGLRRPSATAWVANELARTEPDLLAGLIAVGPALREATTAGDGAALRDLTAHRRTLVADLVARGQQVAAAQDQSFTPTIQRELETTFTAATIDEDAAVAVASRRLLAALEVVGVGFGPGAVPPPRVERREDPVDAGATPAPPGSAGQEGPDDAEQDLAVARLQEADAAAALEAAEAEVADAVEAERAAAEALRVAKARLSDARADLTAAKADAAAARRSVEDALARLHPPAG